MLVHSGGLLDLFFTGINHVDGFNAEQIGKLSG